MEWCFGAGLDNLEEVLGWDPATLDDTRFRGWKECVVSVVNIGARYGLAALRAKDTVALAAIRAEIERRSGKTGEPDGHAGKSLPPSETDDDL